MNEASRLFLTIGKGAEPACQSCYARNSLLLLDKLAEEKEWLRQEVLRLEREVGGLRQQLTKVTKERDDYGQRLARLLHGNDKSGKKEKLLTNDLKPKQVKEQRKRPGAKPGHVGFSRKKPPQIDEVVVVNPMRCPRCQGQLKEIKGNIQEDHIVEDLVTGSVKVTNYQHHRKYCPRCRRIVRVRHQAEIPKGRLGPGVIAKAARLKFENRIPWRMIGDVLHATYGLKVTESALVQRVEHLSSRFKEAYSLINERIRASEFLHADETGWPIDGTNGWLWVFTNNEDVFYKIDQHRSSKVVTAVLGEKYGGVLISDFYSAYNKIECLKQKCLLHFQNDFHDVDGAYVNDGVFNCFHEEFDDWVRAGRVLKGQKGLLREEEYTARCRELEARLDKLISYEFSKKTVGHVLIKRIQRHRNKLSTFLYHRDVEYQNNRAERQLRPDAVIRKISYGSRSALGARMHEIIMTILQTCKLQGTDFDEVCRVALLEEPTGKELLNLIYNNDTKESQAPSDKPP